MTLTEDKNKLIREEKTDRFLQNFFITKILRDPDLREYLQLLISKILNIPLREIQDGFELMDIRVGSSKYVKDSEVDLVARTSKFIVNIEANYNTSHRISDIKNWSYICAITIEQLPRGDEEDYKNLLPIWQIHLNNYDQFGKGEFIYKSKITDEKYHIPRSDLQSIVDVNVAMLREMGYTGVSKTKKNSLERMLYLFAKADREELEKLYEGNDMMEKVMNKTFRFDKNLDWVFVYNRQKLERMNDLAEAEAKGLTKGREEGEMIGQSNLIKTLYTNGMSIEELHRMSNLDIEKIKLILNDEQIEI